MNTLVAGIDGCKGGWIAVEADGGAVTGSSFVLSLGDYLFGPDAPAIIAIDIPIGLTDTGPRECDPIARRLLGQRRSSVFPAPIRPALAARSREEASAISHQIQGKGVGAQAFGIYEKIREVDALLCDHPELRNRVFEIHPELCFAALGAGKMPALPATLAPMIHPKRSGQGFVERLTLIEAFFGPGAFDRIRTQHKNHVADDDILDAIAATWTALRVRSGQAESIPDPPSIDGLGLPMAMWF
ncbi:MAG: DUF429 domain-containing protein [Fimbriimonadales bacterium]